MADEKQNSWLINLDEIIKYQPEEVMSMFVSDLKTIFAAIHAASGLLSDEEVDVKRTTN
ncbi:MAG: hypothetical protein LCI00_15145 [Chloroflexi bacterium]|nr:hypothetical protein [Chloroflexota bacterium]MCC6892634.1 hypothetical protein [Anaerolineae bacterium]